MELTRRTFVGASMATLAAPMLRTTTDRIWATPPTAEPGEPWRTRLVSAPIWLDDDGGVLGVFLDEPHDGRLIAGALRADRKFVPALTMAPAAGWRASLVVRAGSQIAVAGSIEEQGWTDKFDVGSISPIPVELLRHPLAAHLHEQLALETTRVRPWIALGNFAGTPVTVVTDLPDGFVVGGEHQGGEIAIYIVGRMVGDLVRVQLDAASGALVRIEGVEVERGAVETGRVTLAGPYLVSTGTTGDATLWKWDGNGFRLVRTGPIAVDSGVVALDGATPIVVGLDRTPTPASPEWRAVSVGRLKFVQTVTNHPGLVATADANGHVRIARVAAGRLEVVRDGL
jgi:hypothetical protein